MLTRKYLPFIALTLAAPSPLLAQSVQDFQLPPNPTPTPTPRVQGPVDTEGEAVPVRPRVIVTPTPTPAPVPTPRQTAPVQPIIEQPAPSPSRPAPTRVVPADRQPPATQDQPRTSPSIEEPLPTDPAENGPVVPASQAQAPSADTTAAPAPIQADPIVPALEPDLASENSNWIWPAVGGSVLALLGLGYAFSRRRRSAPPPMIERPMVSSGGPIAVTDIHIRTDAIKLTRSVMNATLHYRVSLINKATRALSNVTIGADIVSAHGGVPMEQQVASASQTLEKRHQFDRIAPGQNVRYEGQITIPLSQVRAIRQNNAALFVPLLRLRVDGATAEPLVKTFVVGLGVPGGGRVMPFRIDEGPRSYEPISARALD